MTDEPTRQITAQISGHLAARIDAIRADHSIDGTPEGGPSIAAIIRFALADWVAKQEQIDAKL